MISESQQLRNRKARLEEICSYSSMTQQKAFGYLSSSLKSTTKQNVSELDLSMKFLFESLSNSGISRDIAYQFIIILENKLRNHSQNDSHHIMQFYTDSLDELQKDGNYFKKRYFGVKPLKPENPQILEKLVSEIKLNEKKSSKSSVRGLNIKNADKFLEKDEALEIGAQCPICICQITHQDICLLGCSHIFHRKCFESSMAELINNKKFPLTCPLQDCEVGVPTNDLEEYLSKEVMNKFYEFSFHNFIDKNHKEMSWCPTAGCPSVFEFDPSLEDYKCPSCKKSYCLKCKENMHPGMTCNQFKNSKEMTEQEKKFAQFAKDSKFKQCPECKFWVERNHGCHHMTCRCNFEFCFKCGQPYGNCNCQQVYDDYYGTDQEDNDDESYYGDDEPIEQPVAGYQAYIAQAQRQKAQLSNSASNSKMEIEE